MINANLFSNFQRYVSFLWWAVIAVVFISFASLAVTAAFLDLMPIRH